MKDKKKTEHDDSAGLTKRPEETLPYDHEMLQTILDNIPVMIAFFDHQGRFQLANRLWKSTLGWSPEEWMHKDVFAELYPDKAYREYVLDYIKRAAGSWGEFKTRTRDGRVLDTSWINIPLLDGSVIGIGIDFTDRKRTEEALRNRESMLQKIFDILPVGLWLADKDGKLLRGNPEGVKIWGAEPKVAPSGYGVFKGRRLPSGEEVASDDWALVHTIRDKVTIVDELLEIDAFDGKKKTILNYTAPVLDAEGNIQGAIVVNQDITDRQRAEEALRESEEKYRFIFEQASDGILLIDPENQRIDGANNSMSQMLGYSLEELKKLRAVDIHPEEELPYVEDKIQIQSRDELATAKDIPLRRKDGSVFYANVRGASIMLTGKRYLMGVFRDIRERKQAEDAVKASLLEKEILLREIHHRVKNNMQIISSLFNLQSGHIKDEGARRMLKEGQLRIRSMALVHEKLYQSRDLSKIDFADYLRSLSAHLFQFFKGEADRIRLETDLEDVYLDINSAVPCGLLVTELMTNALKHAFPAGRTGVIGISLHRREGGAVELRVTDDGVGFPETVDFRRTDSLGLQIVTLLIDQLGGMIELDRDHGSAFTIVFSELEYKTRA